MKRIGAILSRESTQVLLFLLAGLLFGWPLITMAGEGQAMAAYLTLAAALVILLLYLAARGIADRGNDGKD